MYLPYHNSKLVEIFNQLKIYNLKKQPDKCEFLKRACVYLGHITDQRIK